jgi:hypothetical protein
VYAVPYKVRTLRLREYNRGQRYKQQVLYDLGQAVWVVPGEVKHMRRSKRDGR